MRLLIDGNIVLDVLKKRLPHYNDSSKIWKLCETDQAAGFISALTFANLVYIMRKELDAAGIEDVLKKLSLIFHFTDLSVPDMMKAAEMKWDDFEDALQEATAERVHADYIITRNVRDFNQSKIMALTPTEYLNRIFQIHKEK